jgi:hypothetical protein
MNIACVLKGGPNRTISVDGKLYRFEMNPAAGPGFLNRRDQVIDGQKTPQKVWEAVSLWAQQGGRLDETGLCIWDRPPKEMLKPMGGRNYLLVGYEPGERGS